MAFQRGLGLTALMVGGSIVEMVERFLAYVCIHDLRASGKSVLNVGCYNSKFGTINADIVIRDVPRFRLIPSSGKWPFDDNEFDVCTAIHVIEHVPETAPFLAECRRVGKTTLLIAPRVIALTAAHVAHKWIMVNGPYQKPVLNPAYDPNAPMSSVLGNDGQWLWGGLSDLIETAVSLERASRKG